MTAHLLVAEDSATQRAVLVADLEAAGFDVSVARDGQEALDRLHDIGRTVDLVLSDVVMPRLDGLELCRRIKADSSLAELPVVLLTSLQDPLDIVRGLEVGADNFLTKPYDADHLVARVEAVLAARAERSTRNDTAALQLLGQRFVVTAERQQVLELLVGAFEDLVHANQQLRQREQQLAQAQEALAARLSEVEHERTRLSAVLASIPDGIVIVAPDGTITDVNPAGADLGIVGPEGAPATGIHIRDLALTVHDVAGREVSPSSWPLGLAYREGEATTTDVELTLRSADGRVVPVTMTAAPVSDRPPPSEAVAVVRDASIAVFYDRLTALPNRTLFADRVARALSHAQSEDTQIAVLVLSLDRFALVHDSLGRTAEDTLVQIVSKRLVRTVRSDATVARLGGDRFGILIEDIGDVASALRVAGRIASKLERAVTLGRDEVFLNASIGVVASGPDTDAELLLRQATMAMHRAIAHGGARTEVYDESLNDAARRRIFLDAALRRALEQDEFVVHFQPVASLATGQTVESEALVRWQHPDHGLISPAEFIPIAEESDLIVGLGRWVLEQACHQTQQWRASSHVPDLRVSVNLSAKQFEDPDLEADIGRALRASGLPAHALTLEVTESALISDPTQAAVTLEGLRRLGVRIAIDDFGTGYSSLSYLRTFHVDVLKIDRSFVQQVGLDPEASAIVQAIVTLATALGLEIIAEGVETRDQLAWLRRAGCQFAAGFYLSRPVAAPHLERLLARPLIPEA